MSRTVVRIFAGALVLCAAAGAYGQSGFTAVSADAQLRDAAIDAERGLLYLSAYDHNQIWVLGLYSGEQIATIEVERGPSSLALSPDATILACLNRLAESVSLIRTGETSPFATVKTEKGPSALVALPGGGFVVANGFANSLTVINPSAPEQPAVISGVDGVPGALAASESYLAVGISAPPSVLFFRPGGQSPEKRIELPGRPVDIAALDSTRFAAATRQGVYLCDVASGNVVARAEGGAESLAVNGQKLLALSGSTIRELHTADLSQPTASLSLEVPAQEMVMRGAMIVALSPAERTWQIRGNDGTGAPQAPVARRAVPRQREEVEAPTMPAEAPAVVEAEPVAPEADDEPATAAPEVQEPVAVPPPPQEEMIEEDAVPADEPRAQAPMPAEDASDAEEQAAAPSSSPESPEPSRVEADPMAESELETADEEAEVAEAADQRYTTMRPTPLALDRPRPPGSLRPQPMPLLGGDEGLSFSEGLAGMRPLDATEGGFRLPDFSEEGVLKNADVIETEEGGGTLFQGNVEFTIGVTNLRMDNFWWNEETGEIHGWGNVVITQEDASLTADDIFFTAIPAEQSEPASEEGVEEREVPLAADEGYQEDAEERVIGTIQGTNIHIIEPTREMQADYLEYDFSTENGVARNATGKAGVFYFGADTIVMSGRNQVAADNVWITTCDCDHEYYRVHLGSVNLSSDEAVVADDARLEFLGAPTPIFWPKWRVQGGRTPRFSLDFDSGRSADIGYFINVGQRFTITPDIEAGVRLYPTTKEGVGFGLEGSYDFMNTPASPLFRSKGDVRSMITTEGSGHVEWYHRQEIGKDAVFLGQWEQWFEDDFVKKFYYDEYRDRTEPRTFGNLTYTRPRYLASATVRATTNEDVAETERLPEGTYSLFERRVFENAYFTYDAVAGYNEREPSSTTSGRLVNVARLSYDVELGDWLNLVPYAEVQGNWYSDMLDDDSEFVFSNTVALTAQTRFQRTYKGILGFSEFRHIVVPSLTYSYKPEMSGDVEEVPRFDAYDNVFGQTRLEAKIDNLVYGRDAESGDVWQVARVSLYQGTDFWNELRDSEDYEIEIDIRPRPEWGFLLVGERHKTDDDIDLDEPFALQRGLIETYERIFGEPVDSDAAFQYNSRFGDYDRVLTYLYYNDPDPAARWNGRIGFNYAETQSRVFNREVLYGLGYRINEKWSVAFEHRYDFERDTLARQTYEIRRDFHCIDGALAFSERESGWDVQFEIGITAFPGTKVKF